MLTDVETFEFGLQLKMALYAALSDVALDLLPRGNVLLDSFDRIREEQNLLDRNGEFLVYTRNSIAESDALQSCI